MFLVKKRLLNIFSLVVVFFSFYAVSKKYFINNLNFIDDIELIIGEASNLPATWVGTKDVN